MRHPTVSPRPAGKPSTGRQSIGWSGPPRAGTSPLSVVDVPVRGVGERPVVLVSGASGVAVGTVLRSLFAAPRRVPRVPGHGYLVLSGPGTAYRRSRDPWRVDVGVPDPLLDRVTVLAAGLGTAAGFRATARYATSPGARARAGRATPSPAADLSGLWPGLLGLAGCVVVVSDGRFAFQHTEVELLRAADDRGLAVLVALIRADVTPGWAQVVLANQRTLARLVPGLALAPWYTVGDTRAEAAPLRGALLTWAAGT